MEHVTLWLGFLVASGIVVAAGLSLTRNAEKLAAALGWGHALAGFILLGWATSLPEVTISLSAVTSVRSAGLSAGNITGSVLFNLAILAVLDLLGQHRRAAAPTAIAGILGLGTFNLVLMAGLVVVVLSPGLLPEGTPAVAFFLLAGYAATTLHCWWRERGTPPDGEDDVELSPPIDVRRVAAGCLVAGAAILVTGVWLSHIGDRMAATYGLSESFVGTLFLAAVSSLPELVTGVAAVRLGLLTLAAGSILGSNIFNLGILGVCDLVYVLQEGAPSLLVDADAMRMVFNLVAALALTLLAMVAARLRSRGAGRAGLVSWAMLLIYLGALGSH